MTRALLAAALLALAGAARAEAQGTVRAGMTEAEVKAAWGEPRATRTRGEFTYLVFPTPCLPGCGSHDVVILQGGKVVDAVSHSSDRRYEGATPRTPGYTAPEGPK